MDRNARPVQDALHPQDSGPGDALHPHPDHDILTRILARKEVEVKALAVRKRELRSAAEGAPRGRDLAEALRAGPNVAVIAEVKRRSPSAGWMRRDISVEAVGRVYAEAGAVAISVLTDQAYFGGALADLEAVRRVVPVPVLRKDFVISEIQLWEAKAVGADAVLLIVRALDDARLRGLVELSRELTLGALVEVHDEPELERAVRAGATIVGVNNRDLASFRTDLGVSLRLVPRLPAAVVRVAESGIRDPGDVVRLAGAGVDAILVGEALMRAADAGSTLAALAACPRGLPGAHHQAAE